jgi:hypothetical protein
MIEYTAQADKRPHKNGLVARSQQHDKTGLLGESQDPSCEAALVLATRYSFNVVQQGP